MKASSWPYSTVVAASRKKTTPSAVATTVNSANLVSYPLLYNHVPMSVSSSSPYASSSPYNSVPVSVSSSIGSMGVSANIISLPQPDQSCYLKIQTTVLIRFHSNLTTSGSNTGTLEQIRDKDLLLHLWDKGYTPIHSRSLQKIL